MKKILLFIILTFSLTIAQAQSKGNGVLYAATKTINKFHTIDELEQLNKGALLRLYTARTKEILITIPYTALTNKAGTTLNDVGIKSDSKTLKVVEKNKEIADRAFVYTENTINELVAYADTDNLIWSILYFEEIIKKMRLGKNGDY